MVHTIINNASFWFTPLFLKVTFLLTFQYLWIMYMSIRNHWIAISFPESTSNWMGYLWYLKSTLEIIKSVGRAYQHFLSFILLFELISYKPVLHLGWTNSIFSFSSTFCMLALTFSIKTITIWWKFFSMYFLYICTQLWQSTFFGLEHTYTACLKVYVCVFNYAKKSTLICSHDIAIYDSVDCMCSTLTYHKILKLFLAAHTQKAFLSMCLHNTPSNSHTHYSGSFLKGKIDK